jgi:tetratricopeptide (TPR) repeat protein
MNETLDIVRDPPKLTRTVLQWFVDRVGELDRFRKMLDGRDLTQVLTVAGPTGIGKTWLCRRLQGASDERAVPAFYLDLGSGVAFQDLWMVHRTALALGAYRFEALNKALEEATEHHVVVKVESSPASPELTIYGDLVVHGDQAEGPIIKNNIFNLPEESPETRGLVHRLANEAFFQDLTRLGRAEGVVLLLDSYERVAEMPEARTWLQDELLRRIGEGQLPGVHVIMAGETVPKFSSAWREIVAKLSLDPLPAAEVRKYLEHKRPTISEASVTRIYEVTGGKPDQVALIADYPGELPNRLDKERLHEILVQGILRETEGPLPDTMRVAAIPEWFDIPLLGHLLDNPDVVDERLSELRGYSFVEEFERGRFRFSPKARHALLETWDRQRQALGELHERAARHFDERALRAVSDQQRWEFQRQAAGHWLERDERTGIERVRALFQEAESGYALSECQWLLTRAKAVEGLQAPTQSWLRHLKGRLALARNEFKKSSDLLGAVLNETEAGSELFALTNLSLGQLAAEQGKWDAAIEYYEESRRYFSGQQDPAGDGRVMLALGDVHLRQARALGGPMRPTLFQGKVGWRFIQAIPALLVALPFVVFARLIRRWRLPPLHHGMNYRNWTLARLLLTAEQWFSEALSCFTSAGLEELIPDAQLGLAQTYYRLGWWHDAGILFDRVLHSRPVSSSAYWQAQVRKDLAEMELRTGDRDQAIKELKRSLRTFKGYEDIQSQAETWALLGQGWLEKGWFERGLTLMRASLNGFSCVGVPLGIGYALHILRRWVLRSEPTPEQVERVEQVIDKTRVKAYLPRMPDRLAAVMEMGASAGLLLLALGGIILLGLGLLTPVAEIYAYLLSAGTVLRLLGWLIVAIWIFILVYGAIGLGLIVWGARQKLKPERLDRVVTTDESISRVPYVGKERTKLGWRDVQTTVSVDRMLWRTAIPLLSEFWLFGPEAEIEIPATMGWYQELRRDIEDHLQQQSVPPIQRRLDLHIFRSWLGLCFAVSPVLIALSSVLIWNLIELPLPVDWAAWLGIAALFLGMIALVAGPYWWLVLHPLWVRYHLAPRSWSPVVAGLSGLVLTGFAFVLRQQHPFFPIRNWLEWTLHPLGYVLLIVAPLWVLTAREKARLYTGRGKAAYRRWQRALAAILLAAAVGLVVLFVRNEWIPYLPIFQATSAFNRADYEGTIRHSSQAVTMNPNLADGYYARAAAYSELGRYELAVRDLSHLIDSGSAINADYYLFRARAYRALDSAEAACADLHAALNAERWGLSKQWHERAMADWQEWNCDAIPIDREGDQDTTP